MPIGLDEYPIHQAPLSLQFPVSSDRNVYDRCYWNAHDRSGEMFLVTGLGVYPNVGVIDAYATVRDGDRQVTVRMSDALGDDRMDQQVGPYRIEVVKPFEELRLVCEAEAQGLSFDLTWHGSFPPIDEPAHVMHRGNKVILDASRFAAVGTWEGMLRLDDREWTASHDLWVGSRDRSWGIRPVGGPETQGRYEDPAEADPDFGFWWSYFPFRFDDYAIILIAQEDGFGHRILNEAVRVWPQGSGRHNEQLGWPEFEMRYEPGTRRPLGATVHLRDHGRDLTIEYEASTFVALSAGSGYGNDTTGWAHGMWKGRNWVDRIDADLTDPAVTGMVPFGMNDYVGRAVCEGDEGWGLFEHTSIGRHDPSGFADFGSVAG